MPDGIIGSVGVAVVPNADNFWRDFKAKTEAGADNAAPKVKVQADTSEAEAKLAELKARISATSGTVNVKVNSTGADKTTQQMHLLRDSILLIGPSLVPVAGVATGVLAGLLPFAAAAVLGVKGITAEFKAGSLAGTRYGADINTLKGEYQQLQTVAAGGLLKGLDTTLGAAKPAFAAFNEQIGATSAELGNIVAHVAPGLLSFLTRMEPLFLTLGTSVDQGAMSFQRWASGGDGVSKFLAYAQTELPIVEHSLGQLLEAVLRITAGLNPFGTTALRTLGLVSTLINQIPIGVLRNLETVVLSGYAAWRTYGLITGVINGVNTAIAAHATRVAASALVDKAATTASAAAFAAEAAAVATSQAEQAAAVAAAQAEIAAALVGTGSVLEATAVEASAAAAEFATAMQVEADAAIASAAETATAATTAADAVVAAGAEASVGWTAALGPIGALVVGVSLLSATLLGNSSASAAAAEAAQSYSASVKSSTDALNAVNIAQTNKNLSDKGALANLSNLTSANKTLGISNLDLALAVNGTSQQYDGVTSKLKDYISSLGIAEGTGQINGKTFRDQSTSARDLLTTLGTLRNGLQSQILTQTQLNQLNAASVGVTDAQATKAASLYGLVGSTGVAAYLAAEQAAQSNTAQTKAQTLAFQADNDAAGLLSAALQGLAGNNLSTAQAQTSLAQANLGVASSFKANGDAINGSKAAAVANQQAIQGSVTAAQALAEAVARQTNSSPATIASFEASKKALEGQLAAQKELTPAVQAYIDKLFDLKDLKLPATKLDLEDAAAKAALAAYEADLKKIPRTVTTTLFATNATNKQQSGSAGVVHPATGGFISGPGTGTSDSIPAMVSNGEFVVNAAQTSKHLALLKAINAGAAGYAGGGQVGSFTGAGGVQYASQTAQANSFLRAASALDKATGALLKVADLSTSTAAQEKTAIAALTDAAKKAGVSSARLAEASKLEGTLVSDASKRDALLAKLGTAPSTQTTAYDKLTTALDNFNNEKSTIASAIKGGFNIQTAGQTASTYSGTSVAATMQTLNTQIQQASEFAANLAKLAPKLGNSAAGQELLAQLAEGGPSASGSEAAALASATPAQITALVAGQAKLDALANSAAQKLATSIDGLQLEVARDGVATLRAGIATLSGDIKALPPQIGNVLNGTARLASTHAATKPGR